MFSIIYILKFPTFYKNLCKYYCSQLRRHKFLWKIYFKMLSWYELAIPISYATSSTFSFLHNIVRSLKRNLDGSRFIYQTNFGFWSTWERLCSNRERSLLNIRGRLQGYGFQPRPVLATVGSAMSIGLSINGCSHSEKAVWRERTRMTSPKKFGLRWPNKKVWRDSGRAIAILHFTKN